MGRTLTHLLIEQHIDGDLPPPGEPIELAVDQCLLQDATGTLVMLELEAFGIDRVRVATACQYVDHNLIQDDHRNPDDHVFLESACRRYGIHFSRPGNGVSHPVHMQRFGVPGETLLGSDSHTCAAGSLGMLAIGTGGLDVALALCGEPFSLRMPEVWGVRLHGELPAWVSAKDVILEMLRRYGVQGGLGRIIEYHGPGLLGLSAMDRHVIANMGAELGATASVFPSDERTREFLARQGRADAWVELCADAGAGYDHESEIDLSALEPLIAKPRSPGNVVPVSTVVGLPVYQAYIGSSANPGFRDFAVAAAMVRDRSIHPEVSLDVNPSSRQVLDELVTSGMLSHLIRAGARIHQAGCNGCIGMGQAPATGRNSLRTVPRNFPGRSGTREDSVFLCSPETATASALTGVITDPRTLDMPCPDIEEPPGAAIAVAIESPPGPDDAAEVELVKGPNIASLPALEPLPEQLSLKVLLALGDDISTDEILPAGSRVLPFRSNLPRIAEFSFRDIASDYPERARECRDAGGHAIVAGKNYGQGSSREHAALAPRSLGLRAVLAQGFARIHGANLANFGVLPLVFCDAADRERIREGDELEITGLPDALRAGELFVRVLPRDFEIRVRHELSDAELEDVIAGGVINRMQHVLHRGLTATARATVRRRRAKARTPSRRS